MENVECRNGAGGIENRQAVRKQRDIQERSFNFAVQIVRLHRHMAQQGSAGRVLGAQLLRSGTSIGANLEEASGGHSRADFVAKCVTALKEARETHYWLRLIAASETLQHHELTPAINEAGELIAILTTISKNTRAANRSASPEP